MRSILFASIILAQGFTMLPNGRMVFSPEPRDNPSPQYYDPKGGPPIGYGVRNGDVDLYVPWQGGPTYSLPEGDNQ